VGGGVHRPGRGRVLPVMSVPTGKELVQKLKQRYKDADLGAEAPDFLEQVYKFFCDNMVQTANDATHQVLRDYSDWWDSQPTNRGGGGPSKFIAVSEEYHVEHLQALIGKMYELKAPLTLGEKRTNEFKLFQEIEIRGSKEKMMDVEAFVGPSSKFLQLIGKVMVELYPSEEKLHLFVLNGSGINHHVGVYETCIRLVWPNIIVDKNRAASILDILVHRLSHTDVPEVKDLEKKAKGFSEANSWRHCLKDGVYVRNDAIRMVYNDSVSDPPMSKIENRPLKPLHIYEFKSKNGKLDPNENIEELEIPFTSAELVKATSIRVDGGTELTEWEQPKGHNPRPQMNGESFNNGYTSRGSGKVHIRSVGGSPGDKAPRTKTVHEEKLVTMERLFPEGTLKDFVDQVKAAVGDSLGTFTEHTDEKRVVWQHKDAGTSVEFREPNRMVAVSGKEGSVRQILVVLGGMLDQVPEDYKGVETSSRAFTTARTAGSKASKVFETASQMARTTPSSIAAFSISNKTKVVTRNGAKKVPYQRTVIDDFDKEDPVELALKKGDLVTVTEDPEANDGELDRWVYGNLETGESGWFSLSFTRDLD